MTLVPSGNCCEYLTLTILSWRNDPLCPVQGCPLNSLHICRFHFLWGRPGIFMVQLILLLTLKTSGLALLMGWEWPWNKDYPKRFLVCSSWLFSMGATACGGGRRGRVLSLLSSLLPRRSCQLMLLPCIILTSACSLVGCRLLLVNRQMSVERWQPAACFALCHFWTAFLCSVFTTH